MSCGRLLLETACESPKIEAVMKPNSTTAVGVYSSKHVCQLWISEMLSDVEPRAH